VADYGFLGGAIVRVDPAEGTLRTFRDVIPEQNLTGVVFDPVSGLLFVAGTIEGDQGSSIPKAAQAEWAAWNPRTMQRVGGGAFAGAVKTASILEATGTGFVLGQHDGGLFVINARTLALEANGGKGPAGWAFPTSVMLRASDGKLYGLGGGKFYRFDPATGETTAIAEGSGRCLIEASRGRLVFNTLEQIYEYRME
jgi:DNA-binding beta-propeller fold protein YncE